MNSLSTEEVTNCRNNGRNYESSNQQQKLGILVTTVEVTNCRINSRSYESSYQQKKLRIVVATVEIMSRPVAGNIVGALYHKL